jgi:AcrR family transcriptional regulator
VTPKSRRRGAALESAILDAAWQVLTEHGYGGFTYEAVAAAAGTSRPVLYRRWPERDELLMATLAAVWAAEPIEVPDTGDLRADAIGLLRNADVGRARMIALMSVQMVDHFRTTGGSFRQLRDALRPPGELDGFDTVVARAIARGDIPDVPRSPRVVELPLDLFRHEVVMTMRPVPDDVIAEIVDDVWLPLLRQEAAGP